ncbi:MAG: hypothetical protein EWV89_08650 [Microcystis wesenbergii Mw_QC_B_20070930_S4]|jgi:hypothetical protein|nr:MAG: hypothetical protein EWV73_13250 [Microcystis wesenbergii Mw_QC_B_20070930_S4D]TRV14841.1 MAG: hypothetical protein EWV89_08650 [Microcystis wesenbergii Mw_QC_B_20070930_S4]
MSKPTVMVIGGTRGTGKEVVKQLIQKGIPCIVGARTPSKAFSLFGDRVDIVPIDVTRTESLQQSLLPNLQALIYTVDITGGLGGRGFFASSSEIRKVVYQGLVNTVDVAKKQGFVNQFILLTTLGTRKPSWLIGLLDLIKPGILSACRDKVTYLENSGLPYTIIQAGLLHNWSTSPTALVIQQGEIKMSIKYQISRCHLAQVIVTSIANPDTYHKTFNVYGGKEKILNLDSIVTQFSVW